MAKKINSNLEDYNGIRLTSHEKVYEWNETTKSWDLVED